MIMEIHGILIHKWDPKKTSMVSISNWLDPISPEESSSCPSARWPQNESEPLHLSQEKSPFAIPLDFRLVVGCPASMLAPAGRWGPSSIMALKSSPPSQSSEAMKMHLVCHDPAGTAKRNWDSNKHMEFGVKTLWPFCEHQNSWDLWVWTTHSHW